MGEKMDIHKTELPIKDKVSLDTIEAEGLQNIKAYLHKLYTIWKEFGINEEQKVQRGKIVWKHLHNLLQDIVDEEQSFYDDINERILNYTKKIEELSKILSVTPKEGNSTSLISKEEHLRQELDNLTKIKHKRIKTYKELRNLESNYCSLLGIKEHQLPSFTGVPSDNDLFEIEQHVQMLKKERDRRHNKLCLAKKELTTILEVTELTPETPLEKEILSGSHNVSLTNETLKALEEVVTKAHKRKAELEAQKKNIIDKLAALWNRLKVPESVKVDFLSKHVDCRVSTLQSMKNELERCEKMKKDNIKMFVDTLRSELRELWDKCYASDLDREFCLYHTNEMTDDVLDAHEAEVEKWKSYHEEVKNILTKISRRKELWELLITFENKATDPNRFKNRRGNLLQEEKERKKLQKDLPALENDIFHDIELYEAEHGKPFLCYGEDYRSFVTKQWQERIDQKENEKVERHKQRLLLAENEALLGTPGKRQLLATPKSAPSKLFKTNTGISVYRTPIASRSKVMPHTVGKSVLSTNQCVNSSKKSSINCKLFPSSNSRRRAIKKKDQLMVLRERNQSKNSLSKSPNSTTYSEFANELNSTARRSFRSSVLSTKKSGGTRISHNTSKGKRKSVSKSLRRSMRNISKTTSGLTPARGKLGLPFLI